MTIDDYKTMLDLQQKAHEAREPWEKAAREIANEMIGQGCTVLAVEFDNAWVVVGCEGWGQGGGGFTETFPISKLFDRLGVLR